MAVVPPYFVATAFLAAVVVSLVLMVYIAWRGSKPSSFFQDSVMSTYQLELPEQEINDYYDLKEKLQSRFEGTEPEVVAPLEPSAGAGDEGTAGASAALPQGVAAPPGQLSWVPKLSPEEQQALSKALLLRLMKVIDRLDQVQRDKPGNWQLWKRKLVSERYWASLCDAERLVGEEIDSCLAEAEQLKPGWREHIFHQAVQFWRIEKQREREKKAQKKSVEHDKRQKEKEERRKVVEEKQAEEEKVRQERLAEKAMEKLLREEAMERKGPKGKATAAKPKAKRK